MDKTSSSGHRKAAVYFNRKAELFDSLYCEEKTGAFMRFLNRHFRSDIYERYYLTIDHIKQSSARSVLDVGIGSGRYIGGYIEAGVGRIVGVDISSSMLDLAHTHLSGLNSGSAKCEFVLADIDTYSSDERFDVVVAMGFFDYIAEPVPRLAKLRGLCNESVIASFPSISFYRTPLRKVRYAIKRCPVYFYRVEEIKQLARESGFSDCEVTKIKGAGMDYIAIMTR
ncbi:MAG: class I SAM-dependent methyltransferase [Candidatus Zixiibacteriota bacterium]